jgi:hypothetical protein
MTDLRTAAQQALEALHEIGWSNNTRWQSDRAATVIPALRAALAEPVQGTAFDRWWDNALDGPTPMAPVSKETALWIWNAAKAEPLQEPQCNPHPKAPHGFLRNASHNEDRYVCECEGWDPYEAGYQAGMEAALRAQS